MKQVRTSLSAFLLALIALAITVFILQPVPSQAAPSPQLFDDCLVITTTSGSEINGSLEYCLLNIQSGYTITFSSTLFPPNNPATIYTLAQTPIISQYQNNITIDGTGAGVIIDGSRATNPDDVGLVLDHVTGVTIKGLRIQNFPSGGIFLRDGANHNTIGGVNATPGGGCSGDCNLISGNGNNGVTLSGEGVAGNTVSGNFIGTDVTGMAAVTNTECGVWMGFGASYNTIGGDEPGEGNLVSGNRATGVSLDTSDTFSNTISGNFIGTNADGTAAIPNRLGVHMGAATHHNTVVDNLVSGNNEDGIAIYDAGTSYNTFSGNTIGTNAAGTAALGNAGNGFSMGEQLGYIAVIDNLISGNGDAGVRVYGGGQPGVSHATISGNIIGADATGSIAIPNAACGVCIEGATEILIGGDTPAERNLISGNGGDGVLISQTESMSNTVSGNFIGVTITGTAVLSNHGNGVTLDANAGRNAIGGDTPGEANLIGGSTANGVAISGGAAYNTVSGNFIGVDLAGTTVLSNGLEALGSGVAVFDGAHHNTIGGENPGEGNTIGGNNPGGVALFGDGTTGNTVSGNIIGLENAGNAQAGVFVVYGAQNNLIGGPSAAQGNTIAHNAEHGISVMGADALNNTLSHNSIFDNGADGAENTGIELTDGGNTELFPPILTDVSTIGVEGLAPPDSTVEIYSDAGDEGRYFHGATTADASGAFSFSQTEAFTGTNVTATATDGDGNTSRFSAGYAPQVDAQIVAIFKPKSYGKVGQTVTPTVKIGNAGTTIEVVTVTVETDTGYADAISGTQLPALGYTTLTFAPFTPSAVGTVHFTATVELPGDQQPDNNIKTVTTAVGSDVIDLWTRDSAADGGDIPTANFWESPDIWVRNTCDGGTEHQNPIVGQTSCVYLIVHNRGDAATSGADTANVYWHNSSLGIKCGDWAQAGTGQTIPSLAANTGETILSFEWTPTRTGHTCLHGEIVSVDDPIAHACDIAWDNNLSQRNVDIIAGDEALGRLTAAGGINFEVTNIKEKPKLVSLIVDVSTVSDAEAVRLDLGDDLANRWVSVNGPNQSNGISWNGGSVITVTDAASGTIAGIPFAGGETQTVTLRVDAPSMDIASVTVYEAIDGGSGVSLIDSIVGGNTYLFNTETQFIYLPIVLK